IYFSSDRPGGLGGFDIYYATRPDRLSAFGPAVNLGAPINTSGDEVHPNLSADRFDFYFVHSENNDWDNNEIFHSHWNGASWDTPQPVVELNTAASESYPYAAPDGTFYFTTNREKHLGAGDDLWYVNGTDFTHAVRLPYLNTTADERTLRMVARSE